MFRCQPTVLRENPVPSPRTQRDSIQWRQWLPLCVGPVLGSIFERKGTLLSRAGSCFAGRAGQQPSGLQAEPLTQGQRGCFIIYQVQQSPRGGHHYVGVLAQSLHLHTQIRQPALAHITLHSGGTVMGHLARAPICLHIDMVFMQAADGGPVRLPARAPCTAPTPTWSHLSIMHSIHLALFHHTTALADQGSSVASPAKPCQPLQQGTPCEGQTPCALLGTQRQSAAPAPCRQASMRGVSSTGIRQASMVSDRTTHRVGTSTRATGPCGWLSALWPSS